MKTTLLCLLALLVVAVVGLPIDQLMIVVAVMAVLGGAFALMASAGEWSGKLFTAGIGLALLGSFWPALSFQIRRLVDVAIHTPIVIAVLAIVAVATMMILATKSMHGSKKPTKPARQAPRARAALGEPTHLDDHRVPRSTSSDDLDLLSGRRAP